MNSGELIEMVHATGFLCRLSSCQNSRWKACLLKTPIEALQVYPSHLVLICCLSTKDVGLEPCESNDLHLVLETVGERASVDALMDLRALVYIGGRKSTVQLNERA